MKYPIIILAGNPMAGKTTLARLLILNGELGAIVDEDELTNLTLKDLKLLLHQPRVVFTATNENTVKANAHFKELQRMSGMATLVFRISPGDGRPVVSDSKEPA